VCGLYGQTPFLLTEDLTHNGEHTIEHVEGGCKFCYRNKPDESKEEVFCDLGIDGIDHTVKKYVQDQLGIGSFDLNKLKYFSKRARLQIE